MLHNVAHLTSTNSARGDRNLLIGFLLFNAIFRGALIGVNGGEYTDGILQIIQFHERNSFWPPLYTALIWIGQHAGLDAIFAGRLISCAASVLLVIPIWMIARMWGGSRTALFAMALYTVCPMALRWSIRVMTDMPFLLLFMFAIAAFFSFWKKVWERGKDEGVSFSLILATIFSVLATLTRYQGLLLLPLILIALVMAFAQSRRGRWLTLLSQILWLALPAWLFYQHFGHWSQVLERTSPLGLGQTLLNYLLIFESFLYMFPYFLTLPVFCFFVYGLISRTDESEEGNRRFPLLWILLYVSIAVLVAQSAFQSYQERYLLPIVPLVLIVAGWGMARAERQLEQKTRRWRILLHSLVGLTIVWSLVFAMLVVMLQRGAFADLYEAGNAVKSSSNESPIYNNETYKELAGVKFSYITGHPVRLIPEVIEIDKAMRTFGGSWKDALAFLLNDPQAKKNERMPVGSIVALHSAYGGVQSQQRLAEYLNLRYKLRFVDQYQSSIVPLFPDIMQEPGTHQNPLALVYRYQPQHFRTLLFIVEGYI